MFNKGNNTISKNRTFDIDKKPFGLKSLLQMDITKIFYRWSRRTLVPRHTAVGGFFTREKLSQPGNDQWLLQ